MGVLGGKIGEGVVRYWQPTNSFLLFGVLTSVPILVKIDQEMRPWECSLTDRQTDRQTHRHTDANRFYNLSHAICYSMGQIIIIDSHTTRIKSCSGWIESLMRYKSHRNRIESRFDFAHLWVRDPWISKSSLSTESEATQSENCATVHPYLTRGLISMLNRSSDSQV